jgi:hypothetical protein
MTARARRRKRSIARAARIAPSPPPAPPPPPPGPDAEALLLELARSLGPAGGDLAVLVATTAAAYEPAAPLARALRDEVVSRRDDKTARLALAWAREQVRLALVEVLQAARAARRVRPDGDLDTLAWLWLAGCEALALEPPEAVADRVQALTTFLRGAER